MLYRIFTENKNVNTIINTVERYFEGFTLIEGIGYYKGNRECSLCIEILITGETPYNFKERIKSICSEINTFNKQECCLVECIQCTYQFV